MVDTIHDNTITAKEQVDEVRFKIRFIKQGYKHLLNAEENSKGTRLKLAYLIFFLTFLLLLYNWYELNEFDNNKQVQIDYTTIAYESQ